MALKTLSATQLLQYYHQTIILKQYLFYTQHNSSNNTLVFQTSPTSRQQLIILRCCCSHTTTPQLPFPAILLFFLKFHQILLYNLQLHFLYISLKNNISRHPLLVSLPQIHHNGTILRSASPTFTLYSHKLPCILNTNNFFSSLPRTWITTATPLPLTQTHLFIYSLPTP